MEVARAEELKREAARTVQQVLGEAEEAAARLRAEAMVEADRLRADASKAVELATSAEARQRRANGRATAELAAGQMNVARSVLSEELRILDEDTREEHEEQWERIDQLQREAEAEAVRVLAEAEAKAAVLLEQAKATAHAHAEEEARRLREAAEEAQRGQKAEAERQVELAVGHFQATRQLLSAELRMLDEDARADREAEREAEQEARARASAEADKERKGGAVANEERRVEIADGHFRASRSLLSTELRILEEEARVLREVEEEEVRARAEAEAERVRREALQVKIQAEHEAKALLRRAEEEAMQIRSPVLLPSPHALPSPASARLYGSSYSPATAAAASYHSASRPSRTPSALSLSKPARTWTNQQGDDDDDDETAPESPPMVAPAPAARADFRRLSGSTPTSLLRSPRLSPRTPMVGAPMVGAPMPTRLGSPAPSASPRHSRFDDSDRQHV